MKAMKDSDAEWLGSIPSQWETMPLYRIFGERKKRNIGFVENNVLSLSYGSIVRRDVSDNMGLLPESFETYNVIEPSNIVLRLTDMQNDQRSLRTGLVKERGIITSAYLTLAKKSDADSRFFHYLLHTYDVMKIIYNMGNGVRQNLKYAELSKLPMLVPGLGEQQRIADFLDAKSSQIDVIVEKQQQIIEKLKAYKQSVITEAVTKGLDPTVPMKDSGVEWIGKVPQHWEIVKLKTYAKLKTGTTPSTSNQEYFDGEYDWFTPSDFDDKLFLHESSRKLNYLAVENGLIPEFDAGSVLLIAIGATLGKSGYVNKKCSSNQQITAITPTQKIFGKFLGYYFKAMSHVIRDYALYTTLPIINNLTLGAFKYALPPMDEQECIANYLDIECRQLERCISKKVDLIAKLTDYKKSLIYEAVTGKIEV